MKSHMMVPLEGAACPHCIESLMDPNVRMDAVGHVLWTGGRATIALLVRDRLGREFPIHCHPTVGNTAVMGYGRVPNNEVLTVMCPHCRYDLLFNGARCPKCSGPMFVISVSFLEGGSLKHIPCVVCTRKGCAGHVFEPLGVSDDFFARPEDALHMPPSGIIVPGGLSEDGLLDSGGIPLVTADCTVCHKSMLDDRIRMDIDGNVVERGGSATIGLLVVDEGGREHQANASSIFGNNSLVGCGDIPNGQKLTVKCRHCKSDLRREGTVCSECDADLFALSVSYLQDGAIVQRLCRVCVRKGCEGHILAPMSIDESFQAHALVLDDGANVAGSRSWA